MSIGPKYSPCSRLTMVFLVLLAQFGWTQPSAPKTTVIEIVGPKFLTQKSGESKWFQGFELMNLEAQELLQTGQTTSATIGFHSGGSLVLSPNSRAKIVNQGVEQPHLELTAGALWGKFSQSSQPLRLSTPSGVLKIDDGEFHVEIDHQGQADLKVIEGQVELEGRPEPLEAGQRGRFENQVWRVASYTASGSSVWAAREAAFALLGEDAENTIGPIVNRALWYLPDRYYNGGHWGRYYYNSNYYYAHRALGILSDPGRGILNEAAWEVDRHVGWGISSLLRRAAQTPTRLKDIEVTGKTPLITWSKFKGAHTYAVVISQDSEVRNVIWSTVTQETKTQYPAYGPEIPAGTHHASVFPLNKKGEPIIHKGRSLGHQTTFYGEHSPNILEVYGLVPSTTTPPSFLWQPCRGAERYRILMLDRSNNVVWTGESTNENAQYSPGTRPLPEGSYQALIEAYDSNGFLMGKSDQQFLVLPSWTAEGVEP